MKSLKNKKGFTIVELVIVIAVIAILAAVMIPTFSNIVERANESAAMQEAKNAYTNWLAEETENVSSEVNLCIKSGNYYFEVKAGQFIASAKEEENHLCTAGYTPKEVKDGTLKDGTHTT